MTGLSLASLLLGGIVGYLIGSIPSAYLITRRMADLDLRQHGTGNIGTMNAFEVTGRKRIGVLVLIADVLKGLVPVVVFMALGYSEALLVLMPALVLGHCYPIWLKFHGGRGLATTAGASLSVNPAIVVAWFLLYWLARKIYDHVHFGAIVATAFVGLALLIVPLHLTGETTFAWSGLASHPQDLQRSILIVVLIIFSKHIEPLTALLRKRPAD